MPKQDAYSDSAWKARLGRAMWRAELNIVRMLREREQREVILHEIRVKLPTTEGGDFLCIVKGKFAGKKIVAFHSASELTGAVAGAVERYEAGQLKYKEDMFPGAPPGP